MVTQIDNSVSVLHVNYGSRYIREKFFWYADISLFLLKTLYVGMPGRLIMTSAFYLLSEKNHCLKNYMIKSKI